MALDSRFAAVNGTRLHYLEGKGEGQPFVFLHGNSNCGGVWAPLAEKLNAQGSRVIAVDLKGHGLSDKPRSGYDWASMRDDIVGLLEQLDLRSVVLVGHSRGGGISLLTGAALPDRVDRVVVFEPTLPMALNLPPGVVPQRRAPNTALTDRALRRRTKFDSRQHLFDYYRVRDAFKDWREDYLRTYVEHCAAVMPDGTVELLCPPWVEASLYEAMPDIGPWADVSSPGLPVRVVFGARSGRVREGRDPIAGLRPRFPRVELVVMEDASHFGPMEHPDVFERLVLEAPDPSR